MIRHWTRFGGRPYNHLISDKYRVTLGPRGVMYLNEASWKALGSPKAIEFLFDEKLRTIGIERSEPYRENSFPVKDKSGTRGKIISAAAFYNHLGIRSKRTVQFHDVTVDDDGIMALPLNSITVVSRGAR